MEAFVIGVTVGAVSGASAMLGAMYMMLRVRFTSEGSLLAD